MICKKNNNTLAWIQNMINDNCKTKSSGSKIKLLTCDTSDKFP